MAEEGKWWKSPQGIAAAATVVAMLFGFWFSREKQMWEYGAHLEALDARGSNAISQAGGRLERVEQLIGSLKEQLSTMDRKIDRIDILQREHDAKRKQQEQNGYAPYGE